MFKRRFYRKFWPLLCLLFFVWLCSGHMPQPAYAELAVAPSISYRSAVNTIYIGSDSGALPASQPVTIPALATALTGQGLNNLVVNQGNNAWLLKANVVISPTARLEATNATIAELRLDSPPVSPLQITALRGGQLLIDGIKVTAWEGNAVDTNISNGRSYLLAFAGGRMDILHSEIAYLGWASGEPSGLSWRQRLVNADPTTGATGRLEDSQIHDNYFGMYSFAAYGLTILRNKVYNNLYYGIDPHDDSENFEVAFNEVYSNGKHGIIFSRGCINNNIHDNLVHDNAEHGIMMDRGSNNNIITNNTVYNNQDGFSIFQSSGNLIQNNWAHHNARGIRINATFDTNDVFDDISTNNQLIHNRIEDNLEHGIYLYARADRNIITDNTILRSGANGIYIKSGGNVIQNNLIQSGAVGINILGGDLNPAQAKPPLDPPGHNNIVISSTISANSDTGIRILGGGDNRIGPANAGEKANRIEGNLTDGIAIGKATNGAVATGNQLLGNLIRNNGRHGILIKDISSVQNRISRNGITGNGVLGIKIDPGGQAGILPPGITTIQADGHTTGAAQPNALVELYSDPAGEGETYLGSATANGSGAWVFDLPVGQKSSLVTALQTDPNGNSSAFSGKTGSALFAIGTDIHGQTTITVTVTGASGSVTLADIKAGLGAANTTTPLHCGAGLANAALLQELGNSQWRLNANLFIGPNVTLNLDPQNGVAELQLCSQATVAASGAQRVTIVQSDNASDVATATIAIDYLSFVYLRTHSGIINLDNVKVYSWDPQANNFDQDIENGRAYLIAKYAAAMNIHNSEVSYLGSADGESYGLSWRDINDSATPDLLRTRVTGEIVNSNIHHNYYGVYTFQAENMAFIGNQFHDNVRYGFDPHDFTHDVLVENNLSYNNGAHGFIISRGCNNFTFRNNKAYNNNNPDPVDQAQGFMLDPGSPNASSPQAPASNNLLENNVAYDNEGFGLRILGSPLNQIVNNHFYRNARGIVVDAGSGENLIDSNVITKSLSYGIVTQETANANTITNNTVNENGDNGIYLRSSNNLVSGNSANKNVKAGLALFSSTTALLNNQVLSNTLSGNGTNGVDLRNALKTLVQGNVLENNLGLGGIYLSAGASQNSFTHNLIHANLGAGIRANGATSLYNNWSENQIYGNLSGGISLLSNANLNLGAPQALSVAGMLLTGKANAGATVEIFSDNGFQGQFFEGRTVAAADGNFAFTLASTGPAQNLTAVTIDAQGNASPFSAPVARNGTVVPTETPAPIPPTETPTPTEIGGTGDTPTPTPTPTVLATGLPTAIPTGTQSVTPTPPVLGSNKLYLPLIQR